MRALISRIVDTLTGRRSLDAAAGGRRWDGAGMIPSVNSAITAGGRVVSQRAAHAVLNNPYLKRGVKSLTANVTGTGIWPKSRHPAEATRSMLDAEFTAFAEHADITGRLDFAGVQVLVARSLIVNGEAFIRRRVTDAGELALQLINVDQVDPSLHRDLTGGARIRSGIEFDADGRPVAYHVLPTSPGDVLAPARWEHVRVPASEMLHVFEPLDIGQVRGLSWMDAVLLKAKDFDEYEDAQLVRQKVAALLAGFLVDATGAGSGGPFEGNRFGSVLDTGLEPGTLKTLPPGYDIKFSEPAEVGEVGDFLKQQLRAISAGLGVTYEQMTGDLAGANYSSIRAGLVEFRRSVDVLRWTVLIPQFCRPVWEWFITLRVLRGDIPAGAFAADPRAWLAADWHPPAWEWVDPLKDWQAEKLAVEEGFRARSAVIAKTGEDPEHVDALRAEDKARAERLGLNSAPVSAPRSAGGGSPFAAAGVEPEADDDPAADDKEEGEDA